MSILDSEQSHMTESFSMYFPALPAYLGFSWIPDDRVSVSKLLNLFFLGLIRKRGGRGGKQAGLAMWGKGEVKALVMRAEMCQV